MPRKKTTVDIPKTTVDIPVELALRLGPQLPGILLHLKSSGYTSYPALEGLLVLEDLHKQLL